MRTPKQQKLIPHNLNGDGDCGFRSLAGSFIDLYLTGKLHNRLQQGHYDRLLNAYFHYYPARATAAPADLHDKTAAEKMAYLLSILSPRQLAIELAFPLRQLTVTEMGQNPHLYPGVFAQIAATDHKGNAVDTNTTMTQMRQQRTWIDEGAIGASVKVLGLSVQVDASSNGITEPLIYNNSQEEKENKADTGPMINIQLIGKHYVPLISASSATSFTQSPRTFSQPIMQPRIQEHKDPSDAQIKAKCLAADQANQAVFNATQIQLSERKPLDLIKLYVEYLHRSEYLRGYLNQPYAKADFKAVMAATQSKESEKVDMLLTQCREVVLCELTRTLAHAITIGDIPRNVLNKTTHTANKVLANSHHGLTLLGVNKPKEPVATTAPITTPRAGM